MNPRLSYAARAWCAALAVVATVPLLAADVTNPAEVANLAVDHDGTDVFLSWDPVTTDVAGNPETITEYRIYRGDTPDFAPDKSGGSNRIGTATSESFTDFGAASDGIDRYYLVSAVDASANESATSPSRVTTPPTLTGASTWTDTGVHLEWTAAAPAAQVASYRVYYGQASRLYEFVDDVGLVTSYDVTGIAGNVNWYFAVTAVDLEGNETDFSNEHVDPVGGTIDVRVHDEHELCWGAANCTPSDPDAIQRRDGFQILVPGDFPEGDWTSVTVTFTTDSRLCTEGQQGTTTRCGDSNPGGYNPCGDPWDRIAYFFLVLDDCIAQGGSCVTHDNVELIHAITPFGTDAPAPDGRGIVPPREFTLDITPLMPLLAGQTRYVGADIGHFVQKGWWVTSDFHFSKRPEEISPKPPAAGIEPVFFHSSGAGRTGPFPVTIPATATQVIGRLFVSGHGANDDPDCGSGQGDEFCPKTNRILVDTATAWEDVPWNDCCHPRGTEDCDLANCPGNPPCTRGCNFPFDDSVCWECQDWNSCGYPSCTFDRSGWCPGEISCHDDYDSPGGCDQDLDLTNWLVPGGTYDVEYEILLVNGNWARSLVVYWYE